MSEEPQGKRDDEGLQLHRLIAEQQQEIEMLKKAQEMYFRQEFLERAMKDRLSAEWQEYMLQRCIGACTRHLRASAVIGGSLLTVVIAVASCLGINDYSSMKDHIRLRAESEVLYYSDNAALRLGQLAKDVSGINVKVGQLKRDVDELSKSDKAREEADQRGLDILRAPSGGAD